MFTHTLPILKMFGLDNNTGSDDYCTVMESLYSEMEALSKTYTQIEDYDFAALVTIFNDHRYDLLVRVTDDANSYEESYVSFVQSIANNFNPTNEEVKALFIPGGKVTDEVKAIVTFYVIDCMFF